MSRRLGIVHHMSTLIQTLYLGEFTVLHTGRYVFLLYRPIHNHIYEGAAVVIIYALRRDTQHALGILQLQGHIRIKSHDQLVFRIYRDLYAGLRLS